jgi:hypothetical protein
MLEHLGILLLPQHLGTQLRLDATLYLVTEVPSSMVNLDHAARMSPCRGKTMDGIVLT